MVLTVESAQADAARGWLAPHIRAVEIGEDLVLLDLRADDYLLFPQCGRARVRGSEIAGPSATIDGLNAAGFMAAGPTPESWTPPPRLPRGSLPPSAARATLTDRAVFAAIWLDAVRRRLTLNGLARRSRGRSGDRADIAALAARVEIFRGLLPWAPWTGACLLQTELLLRFLNAGGLDADWVFGVRAWPFLAHCWLQVDDVCISQSADTLSIYRPLMVI